MNDDLEKLNRAFLEAYDMFDKVDVYRTIQTSGNAFEVVFGISIDVDRTDTKHDTLVQIDGQVNEKFRESLFLERVTTPLLSKIETLEKEIKELERIKTYIEVEKEIRGTK